jgi:hypothetical protein
MWRRDGLPARNLVSRGLLELVRRVHFPGPYPSSCGRHAWTYRLTEKGRDLFVGLNALRQWGDRHLSPAPMRLLRRRSDGAPVVAALVPEGTPSLAPDELELVPGPGFPR